MIKKYKKDTIPEEERLDLDDDSIINTHLVDELDKEIEQSKTLEVANDEEADSATKLDGAADDVLDQAKVSHEQPDTVGVATNQLEDGNDRDLAKAINDIVAKEADVVLEAEDNARSSLTLSADDIAPSQNKVLGFIKSLWLDSKRRWAVIILLSLSLAIISAVPKTRYFVLNTAGVRASVQLRVIDSATLQPLKNVSVKLSDAEAFTDSEGNVRLDKVKLGEANLVIAKRAFASHDKNITIGWGSNPLGDFSVEPVGSSYTFYMRDFLSKNPLNKVEAISGEGNAISDQEGRLVLVMDTAEMDDDATFDVDFMYDGYRVEKLTVPVNNRESQSVDMVPGRPHVFVSKRSGKYDVYAIDLDGKNERRVLEGSGFEKDDISILPHPTKNIVAYIASRENVRNKAGYLLSTAYIIDVDKNDIIRFDQSEYIKLIGWSGEDRLVYGKIAAGASGPSPDRHRLMSLDIGDNFTGDNTELASSNYFNDVVLVGDNLFYAPSNIFNENTSPAVYMIKADGRDNKSIIDQEAYEIVRTDYGTLFINTSDGWYRYTIDSAVAVSSNAPSITQPRLYVDALSDKFSLWVDNRDGKGVLLSHDRSTTYEKIIIDKAGLKQPVYWINEDNAVYRVSDGRETADYVVNIATSNYTKIVDVTDSRGLSGWYR